MFEKYHLSSNAKIVTKSIPGPESVAEIGTDS